MTGVCYKHRGELERAAAVFEGCAQLCASVRDAQGEAGALGNFGQALTARRRLAEAEGAHGRSLELARSSNDENGELSALFHVGTLQLRGQRFEEAEASLALAHCKAMVLSDEAAEVGVLQRLAAARSALHQLQCQQTQQRQQQQQHHHQQQQPLSSPASIVGLTSSMKRLGATPTSSLLATVSVLGANSTRIRPSRGASRFVLTPAVELSTSFSQRNLATVSPPAVSLSQSLPLPPLQGAPLTPTELLEKADRLARGLGDGGLLRMQVLRQLRAEYAVMGDMDSVCVCEREIDAVHRRVQPGQGS